MVGCSDVASGLRKHRIDTEVEAEAGQRNEAIACILVSDRPCHWMSSDGANEEAAERAPNVTHPESDRSPWSAQEACGPEAGEVKGKVERPGFVLNQASTTEEHPVVSAQL